jgi:hypothetical protein
MHEVKFMDGTPVPDDYLTSVSLLVRDAALAIDMFGEDELEAASRGTSQDTREAATEHKRCCVSGEEISDEDESAFGACADCLDNVQRDLEAFIGQALSEGEYVLRTYAGREGDVDAAYPTLKAAVVAFQAAPLNSNPRLIHACRILLTLGPKLIPVFSDPETQCIHLEMFGGYVLRTFAGIGERHVDAVHPTLEAALASFAVAPGNSIPQVLRDGRIAACLDPEAGLAPMFQDAEMQRIYWQIVERDGLRREPSKP